MQVASVVSDKAWYTFLLVMVSSTLPFHMLHLSTIFEIINISPIVEFLLPKFPLTGGRPLFAKKEISGQKDFTMSLEC